MLHEGYVCTSCRALSNAWRLKVTTQNVSRRTYAVATTQRRPPRLAIIGAGPAGYYSAYRIMKKMPEAYVDMYEALPTPYGLVRFGVAPDHPEVKKSSENLDDVAKWPNFNYIGNVPIGKGAKSLPLDLLAQHYDGILFSYGASKDKTLGLKGEGLRGVYSARGFVGWYNGSPEYAHLEPDLQKSDTAVILGQGNVALDVARMLLAPIEELRRTDITESAIEALSKSRIRRVNIVGRRGPLQAPATIKELRELMTLEGVQYQQPSEGWTTHVGKNQKSLPRQLKRIVELLVKGSDITAEKAKKTWQMSYLLSPKEFLGDGKNLTAIEFAQMDYKEPITEALSRITNDLKDKPDWERLPAMMNRLRQLGVKKTDRTTTLDADVAFRSIGYLSEPIEGLADIGIIFDTQRGIIPNDIHGRVLSPEQGPGALTAGHVAGMYCAGWVKRGPTGVIASTLDDAFRTADILVSDWENGVKFNGRVKDNDKAGLDAIWPEITKRGIRSVDWQDWQKIEAEERRRGELKDKVREKMTNIDEMLSFLDS